MKLFNFVRKFGRDEDGAVTVDWVVLTAAIVGLGIAVIMAVGPGINNAATDIANELSNANASGAAALQ
jgi:Flp pilus assembly pilin Flp